MCYHWVLVTTAMTYHCPTYKQGEPISVTQGESQNAQLFLSHGPSQILC